MRTMRISLFVLTLGICVLGFSQHKPKPQHKSVSMQRLDSIVSQYQKEYFTYDIDGNNTQEMKMDSNWWSSEWAGDYNRKYEYDEDGKITKEIHYNWEDNDWVERSMSKFVYDADGNIIEETYYNWNDTGWVESSMNVFAYDVNGNRLTGMSYKWDDTTWMGNRKDTFIYNVAQNIIMEVAYYSWDGIDWMGSYKVEHTYDVNENKTKKISYNWGSNDWTPSSKDTFAYDVYENQVMQINYYWDYGINDWMASVKYTSVYDAAQNKIVEVCYYWDNWNLEDWYGVSKDTSAYDANGNQLVIIRYNWNGTDWGESTKYEFEYNSADQQIKYVYSYWDYWKKDWVENQKYEYDYDIDGNLIMEANYNTWDGGITWEGSQKSEYEYDANGNKTMEASFGWDWGGNWIEYRKNEWTYDLNYSKTNLLVPNPKYANDKYDMENKRTQEENFTWNSTLPIPDWESSQIKIYYWSEQKVAPYSLQGKITLQDSGDPLSGVTISCTGDYSISVLTNTNGEYSIDVKANASVTLTPTLAGYTFEPEFITLSNVVNDTADLDFIATAIVIIIPQYVIEGKVTIQDNGDPLSGVAIGCIGGNDTTVVLTDANGEYSIIVDSNASVTLIPTLTGYTFNPTSIPLSNIANNMYNQDFTAITIVGIVGAGSARPEIRVFPNPTTGKLTIGYPISDMRLSDIQIFDIVGKKQQAESRKQNGEIVIDISHLAAGMYFLKVGGKVVKVVKE